MRFYEYKTPADEDHKRTACLQHPDVGKALISFNAIDAKSACGGKRLKLYAGDEAVEWHLVGGGECFPLIEVQVSQKKPRELSPAGGEVLLGEERRTITGCTLASPAKGGPASRRSVTNCWTAQASLS